MARRLIELGAAAREHSGEGLDLIECWRGSEDVILVDAVVAGEAPGTVRVWEAGTAPIDRNAFPCSTHAFGLAEAIKLARILGRLPERLRIYGIEAAQFEPDAGLTPAVAEGIERAAQMIAGEANPCTKHL